MSNTPQPEKPEPEGLLRIPCEVWSRIVGYMRPVQAWNQGKQQEFADRVEYVPIIIGDSQTPDDGAADGEADDGG